MTILEIVQAKLGESNTVIGPVTIDLAIEEVEQAIINYCNINEVPKALYFTWANMTVDLVRYELATSQGTSEDEDINLADMSSIKIGDTSINLGAGSSSNPYNRAVKSHLPNLDEIVMNNREQLQKFRRMVW